jgi:CBS domain-containing protein
MCARTMKVREIMTSNPEAVTPDQPVSHAARVMRDRDVGAVPVVQDLVTNRLIGILTDRDIVVRHVAAGHRPDCPVGEHMTPRESVETFATARPEDHVELVVDLMRRHAVRRIPIVDDNDQHLVGIVAQADIIRSYGEFDPEAVEEALATISAPSHPHPVTAPTT